MPEPQCPHWGVDSSYVKPYERIRVPHRRLLRGDERLGVRIPLFDLVERVFNEQPAFWGRYIGFPATQIQEDEIDYLHRVQGVPILLVYNGARGICISDGFSHGYEHGQNAGRIARGLNVPIGTRIYADLENWPVDTRWMNGWWEAIRGWGYLPGLYGASLEWSGNRCPARWNPVTDDRCQSPRRRYCEDVEDYAGRFTRHRDASRTTRGAEWLFGSDRNPNDFYIWSSRATANAPGVGLRPCEFNPMRQPQLGTAVIWQYRLGHSMEPGQSCRRRETRFCIDLNLAIDQGLRGMWHPPA